MCAAQAASAIHTIAACKGTTVNHERPILETELPLDGSRFEAIISPIVRRPIFAIRLRPRRIFTLEEYQRDDILSDKRDSTNRTGRSSDEFIQSFEGKPHIEIIRAAIRARKNILVVGSTGSRKTTLVNAMLDAIARLTPDDRVISIEDNTELQCAVNNWVDLRAAGDVTMLDCLRACLRLKPTRIVVGEVRGAEAHTLLKAWNTGHPGGIATVHANDALSGLTRLESLVAEATAAPQQRLIAEAVDLVVFIDQEPGLEQGLNSDLPGELKALVASNVYDTATGRYLLIPQGARLVGRYNSVIGYGQNGVQVVWNRIIFPDASSIDLEGMEGQDEQGYAGLRHRVDNHYERLIGFAVLTSLFAAGFELSQSRTTSVLQYPSAGELAGAAVGQQATQLGAEVTRRNLNIQPTIKVPAGYKFNVRVNRDILFDAPYTPMQPSGK